MEHITTNPVRLATLYASMGATVGVYLVMIGVPAVLVFAVAWPFGMVALVRK